MGSIVGPEIVFYKIIGAAFAKWTFRLIFPLNQRDIPVLSKAIHVSTLRDYLPVANKLRHFVYSKQNASKCLPAENSGEPCVPILLVTKMLIWLSSKHLKPLVPSTSIQYSRIQSIITDRSSSRCSKLQFVRHVIVCLTKLCFDACKARNLLCSHTVLCSLPDVNNLLAAIALTSQDKCCCTTHHRW